MATARPRRPLSGGRPTAGGWAPNLTPRIAVRIAVLGGIAVALLGVLLVRLWFLQVISGQQYEARAEGNRLRTVINEAPRGHVLDRNGELLVGNAAGTDIAVRPRELTGRRRTAVLTRLASKMPGTTVAELEKRVESGQDRPFASVVIVPNIPKPLEFYIAQRRRQFLGLSLQKSYVRTYPEGGLAAHALGTTGKIGPDALESYRSRGYLGDETVGTGGVEQQYEQYLRGTPGRDVIEVDAAGEPQGRGFVSSVAPKPGRDLELTIDANTQQTLQNALREQAEANGSQAAAGVALDPNTGEVLALASYPDFDPEVFAKRKDKQIEQLTKSGTEPLFDRALSGVYPTGSTFKPITALAALKQGYITPDTLLSSPSTIVLYKQRFKNFEFNSFGDIPLHTALEVSSDTFFYQLGDKFFQEKASPLQDEAEAFGLGKRTGIDLPGESAGLVPTPAWKRRNFAGPDFGQLDRIWKPGDTIQLSVGQGYFQATPLQMAVAYAAIANGGTVRAPTIGRRILDPNGRVLQELWKARPAHQLDIPPYQLAAVRQGLYEAANGVDGTATGVFGRLPDDVKVAGKTGTAEPGDGSEDHSWFIGYAPFDNPKIVVAVVIEHGGTGANAAAPAVCRTISAYGPTKFDPSLCGADAVAN
jgi:penicillin-binding protein 2